MKKQLKNNTGAVTIKKERNGLAITLLVLFSLVVPTVAGVIIGVRGLTKAISIYEIQGIVIGIGCLLSLVWVKLSPFSLKDIGVKGGKVGTWLVGVMAVEGLALSAGFSHQLDGQTIAVLVLFMVAVGVFEELIYRGLVLQFFKRLSTKKAVIGSALLFGTGHSVNLMSGADMGLTLLQVIFACLFGLVAAEIVLLSKSLLPIMIWHTCHNVIDQLTVASLAESSQLVLVGFQCLVLGVMGLFLWQQLFQKKRVLVTNP